MRIQLPVIYAAASAVTMVTFCFIHFFMSAWVGGDSRTKDPVCLLTTLNVSTLLALPKSKAYGGLGGEKCTDL